VFHQVEREEKRKKKKRMKTTNQQQKKKGRRGVCQKYCCPSVPQRQSQG
jgi:hypothetical protein